MNLAELIKPKRMTEIVDVGANPIDGVPPYKVLLDAGLCCVTGFEPQPNALARLMAQKGRNERYFPDVIGDGKHHRLRTCQAPGMASLLKPDVGRLALFPELQSGAEIRGEGTDVLSRRLDDISDLTAMDFLKIDAQGSEYMVFQNGTQRLSEAVVIQAEVSFVTIYENQPTIGDVDTELRRQGFIPHRFAAIKSWPIWPALRADTNNGADASQLLEADIVYIRDIAKPEAMSDEQLKHMALIAHYCYRSVDLVRFCLAQLDRRGETTVSLQERYQEMVAGD